MDTQRGNGQSTCTGVHVAGYTGIRYCGNSSVP